MDPNAAARHRVHAGQGVPRRNTRRTGKRHTAPGEPGLLTIPPLIRVPVAGIRRLISRVFIPAATGLRHVLRWSLFRRAHQTRALISHYRSRGNPIPWELRM